MSSQPTQITSHDNARIKAVMRLRNQRDRRKSGLFIAEGCREIERAIDAGIVVDELYYCADLIDPSSLPEVGDVFELTQALMGKISYRENPEGVVAICRQPVRDLSSIERRDDSLWLIAVGFTKPGNLGAIVRSAAAAGATAVIAADSVVDPFNPNAIRASTAAMFSVPVICASAVDTIAAMAGRGIRLFAACPAARENYTNVDLTGQVAIAIGAEDTGLDDVWIQGANRLGGGAVSIPVADGPVDSLNASNAAAVLLFEAVRQRA